MVAGMMGRPYVSVSHGQRLHKESRDLAGIGGGGGQRAREATLMAVDDVGGDC